MQIESRHFLTIFFLLLSTFVVAQSPQPDFTTVSAIDNTTRYQLCQQGDSLSFIYDKETGKHYPAMFSGENKYYNNLCYLGERKGEPVFYDYNYEMFGTNGFFAGVIGSTDRGCPGIDSFSDENELCIRDGVKSEVWISLDEIPLGTTLESIFDEKDMVEDGFTLDPPEESGSSVFRYFNMIIPKLKYSKAIRKHILYWIADCCVSRANYKEEAYLCNITNHTKEKDIIECLKRKSIQDNFSSTECDEIGMDRMYPSGEAYYVERILNTKDYASFIIHYNELFDGGTGVGVSWAATFDLKTNRRLTFSDFVEKEAIPTINRILNRQHYGSELTNQDEKWINDELYKTCVVLGWDGLVFHYGRYTISGGYESTYIVPYDSISQWLKIRPQIDARDNSYKIKLTFEPIDEKKESNEKNIYWSPDFAKKYPINWKINQKLAMKNDEEINGGCNINYGARIRGKNPKKEEEIYSKLGEENRNYSSDDLFLIDLYYAKTQLANQLFEEGKSKEAKEKCIYLVNELRKRQKEYGTWWENTTNEKYYPYIDAIKLLSLIAFNNNDKQETINYSMETDSLLMPYLRNELFKLGREKRNTLWQHYQEWLLEDIVRIAHWTQSKSLKIKAYNSQLFGKGLQLSFYIALINYINSYGSTNEKKVLQDYLKSVKDFEEMPKNIRHKKNEEETQEIEEIKRLEYEIYRLEELLKSSAKYSDYMNLQNVTMDQVAHNMRQGEVAIEFAYVVENCDTTYYALTLQAGDTAPDIVRLCTESQLHNMTTGEAVDGRLHRLIWKPLQQQLQGKKTVFFSPSGRLHMLPLEWACEDGSQKSMAERYSMYRLSSTREIAYVRDTIFNDESRHGRTGLLVGGLNYDATISDKFDHTGEEENEQQRDLSIFRSGVRLKKVKKLPATLMEIEDIKSHVSRLDNVDKVELLVGNSGTEETFKIMAENQLNLLHIATHGFYLTDDDYTQLEQNNYFSKIGKQYRDVEEKGLVRSGLVFAGINQVLQKKVAPKEANDGIMTSLEISHMDLKGVNLAVLSACQTAQGEIAQEGVMGLQRGFKKAGVESLLMSLWKVDDQATYLFMTKFYEQLAKGNSKQQALTEAQHYLREEKAYKDPHFWAAFILLDAIN